MLTENSSLLKSWLKLPSQVRSQTLPVVSICDAAHHRDLIWDGSLSQLFSRLLFSVSIQAQLCTEMTSLFTRRLYKRRQGSRGLAENPRPRQTRLEQGFKMSYCSSSGDAWMALNSKNVLYIPRLIIES